MTLLNLKNNANHLAKFKTFIESEYDTVVYCTYKKY